MAVRTLIPQACVGLHALLVIAHLVLLGVWAANAERSVVIFPEQVSSTQTYISLASQAIIIVSVPLIGSHCLFFDVLRSLTRPYSFC